MSERRTSYSAGSGLPEDGGVPHFPAAGLNHGERNAEPPYEAECRAEQEARAPKLIIATNEGREPVARVLLAEVKLVVGLSDEHGEPQGPYNAQPVQLARLDPEGRCRSIVEQLADVIAKAEAQVVKSWKER